jgi:hypothetical protein
VSPPGCPNHPQKKKHLGHSTQWTVVETFNFYSSTFQPANNSTNLHYCLLLDTYRIKCRNVDFKKQYYVVGTSCHVNLELGHIMQGHLSTIKLSAYWLMIGHSHHSRTWLTMKYLLLEYNRPQLSKLTTIIYGVSYISWTSRYQTEMHWMAKPLFN